MDLDQLYDSLRQDRAYRAALPAAQARHIRRSSPFVATPTDLTFAGTETMGVSSTLSWVCDGPAWRQRSSMGGWPTQRDRPQTPGYPNYIVLRLRSGDALASYGPDGWVHYRRLLASRPWDTMPLDLVSQVRRQGD